MFLFHHHLGTLSINNMYVYIYIYNNVYIYTIIYICIYISFFHLLALRFPMSLVTTCFCKSVKTGREDLLNDNSEDASSYQPVKIVQRSKTLPAEKWGGLGRAPKAPAGANPLSKDNESSFFHLLALRFPMSLVTTLLLQVSQNWT